MAHPRRYDDANPKLRRLRKVCFALPDVVEKEAWGECTFRVDGGSMFAMTDSNRDDGGHLAVWIKAPYMAQESLVDSAPEIFFKPPYLGSKGWVGVRLDGAVDWKQVGELLRDGHDMSVPKTKKARKEKAADAKKPTTKTGVAKRKRTRTPSARPRASSS